MAGTPATTPIHGAPRIANTDTFDLARDLNGVADRFDLTAARIDTGLASARPAAGIAGRWYFATDTLLLTRDTGSVWQDPLPNAHASRHQDGGADPLTVREAMMTTGALGMAKGTFSAYRNAASSLATGSIVPFDSEEFDVSSWFDVTTNIGRFTPQVSGYYRLSAQVVSGGATDTWVQLVLRKIGAAFKNGAMSYQRGAGVTATVNAVVLAQGGTDYFDIQITHNTAGSLALAVGAANTYFQGHLLGRS